MLQEVCINEPKDLISIVNLTTLNLNWFVIILRYALMRQVFVGFIFASIHHTQNFHIDIENARLLRHWCTPLVEKLNKQYMNGSSTALIHTSYRKVNQEKIMIGHSRQFQNHPSAAHFPLNEMSFEFTDLAKKTKRLCLTLNTYKRCA